MASDPPTVDLGSGSDPKTDIHRHFWLRHMRIGFGIFLAETIFVLVYLAITPHGPHRTILWIVAVAWFGCAATNLLLAPRLSSWPRRAQFSAFWNILAAFAVGGVAALDGGLDSPLLLLLFLPAAFAALAFTPRMAGACGVATLASATFVWLTDASLTISGEYAVMVFAVLSGSCVLSVAASVNRLHRERNEQLLVEKIAELAMTDGLTGCAVHRVFHQRFEEEIARSLRNGHPLSLMMIDVDTFKAVNDTYGHLVGDHVLAGIGSVLRTQTRSFDLVGRLGGDEFAVLMPDTEASAAVALAERIRLEGSAGLEVPVTLSIGVSSLDPAEPTVEHMLDDADFSLYQVKESGRDGVAVRVTDASVRVDHRARGGTTGTAVPVPASDDYGPIST
jgi:diguanylate cyclase (GGDEF)-like protein